MIFGKPLSQIDTHDVEQLLQESSIENIRLEFKRDPPKKDEILKKLSSFANTFGGYLVVGAEADSSTGRIGSLPGVDVQSGYKQTIVQWCFEGVSPPLVVEVSDPIPVPVNNGKVCYVISTPESEVAPHFLNGRKGIYIRTDEFSSRTEPRLANEAELRHLFDRRKLVTERRQEILLRSQRRFKEFSSRARKDQLGPTIEVSVGPRFPIKPIMQMGDLVKYIISVRVVQGSEVFPFTPPRSLSHHESVLILNEDEERLYMIEASIWGTLFYGAEIGMERIIRDETVLGIGISSLIGRLISFIRHAAEILPRWPHIGHLSMMVTMRGVLNIPWLMYEHGTLQRGHRAELDDSFSFNIEFTSNTIQWKPDSVVIDVLREILFAMNWHSIASDYDALKRLTIQAYKDNFSQIVSLQM